MLFSDKRLMRLHQRVSSCIEKGDFILSAGGRTNRLFHLTRLFMDPQGIDMVGELMAECVVNAGISYIGGPANSGIPLVTAIMLNAKQNFGKDIHGFYLRKDSKDHGSKSEYEGSDDAWVQSHVVIVDDVASSGASLMRVAMWLRNNQPFVSRIHALAVVDREEGAREALAKANIGLHSLLKMSDFPE